MKKEIKLDSIRNFIKSDLDPNSIIERKQFSSQIALQDGEEQTFIAKISTIATDRDGDVLIPDGCDITEFEKNPVCIWNHTYSALPIGKVIAIQKTKEAIYAKIKLASTEFAKEIWDLVKGGFLSTCSVGFVVQNALIRGTASFNKFIKDTGIQIDEDCKRIVTNFQLIENSLVPIPANNEALILATTKGLIKLDDKLAEQMGLDIKACKPKDKEKKESMDEMEPQDMQENPQEPQDEMCPICECEICKIGYKEFINNTEEYIKEVE